MEKRKVEEAVAEWQAEKRRRVEDGEEEVGGEADDDDVEDVQVCTVHLYTSLLVVFSAPDGSYGMGTAQIAWDIGTHPYQQCFLRRSGRDRNKLLAPRKQKVAMVLPAPVMNAPIITTPLSARKLRGRVACSLRVIPPPIGGRVRW